MSPDQFNLYSEVMLRQFDESAEGVVIDGTKINNTVIVKGFVA